MRQIKILFLFIVFILASAQNAKAVLNSFDKQEEVLQQELLNAQNLFKNSNLYEEPLAGSYIAVDISNGSILLQKNSNKKFSIASVTKLMNAVVSVENIDMNSKIKLTKKMLSPQGKTPVLYEGLEITANDLLKATLIQSSNDSAEALSYFVGNKKFISLMNNKAKELKMSNTSYYDAHGLNLKNKSTASDLAKLISYIYNKHPQILELTKNNDFWLPDKEGNMFKFKNQNSFYNMSDFIGGKSGYLEKARQNFNSVFNINEKPIAIAVLYSNNKVADVFSILRKLK